MEMATKEGYRPVPVCLIARRVFVQGVAGFQESCSLRVLYKMGGVVLPRLNIAPSPIVNK